MNILCRDSRDYHDHPRISESRVARNVVDDVDQRLFLFIRCAMVRAQKTEVVSTICHFVDIQRWNNWRATKLKRDDTGWEAIGSDLSSERMMIGKREGWTTRALKANEIGILLTIDTAIVLGAEPLPLFIFKHSIYFH